ALGRFLDQPELSRYRELLFVAHSFGGLVTLRYVLNVLSGDHGYVLRGTKVLLLGVPLDGADIAKWGQLLSCQAAAAHIGSHELARLHRDLEIVLGRSLQGPSRAEPPIKIRSLVAAGDRLVSA